MLRSRKYLSSKGLLTLIRGKFKHIHSSRLIAKRSVKPIALVDCLMSGLAIFSMKFPSLLQFEEQSNHGGMIKRNLRTLYQIDQVPSDTYLRERLDEIDSRDIRKVFKTVFSSVQRGKALEDYTYLDGHYLLPMDMTGFFSSPTIHCENCCVKKHNKPKVVFLEEIPKDLNRYTSGTYLLCGNLYTPWQIFYINDNNEMIPLQIGLFSGLNDILIGRARRHLDTFRVEEIKEIISTYHETQYPINITYYHNMMCAAIVHPDIKVVLPFAPEPVLKSDGLNKNDCERNASKRLIGDIRREHPHLKLIVVQDALGSNYPNLQELKNANMRFIIGAKPGDHKALFQHVNNAICQEHRHTTEDGTEHHYRYLNSVGLNDSHADFKVNFLEYWETDKRGNTQHFSWVTDIEMTTDNVYQIMKGGRANWKIENNTFNTLKNQGYHFAHNFGHGYRHLCSNFGMLMMLAFFVDQVQELCCDLFKKARARFVTRIGLWSKMKSLFMGYIITSWDDLFNAIAHGHEEVILIPNTS